MHEKCLKTTESTHTVTHGGGGGVVVGGDVVIE